MSIERPNTDREATPEERKLAMKMLEEAGDPGAAIDNFHEFFKERITRAEMLVKLEEQGIAEEEYLNRLPPIEGEGKEKKLIADA